MLDRYNKILDRYNGTVAHYSGLVNRYDEILVVNIIYPIWWL